MTVDKLLVDDIIGDLEFMYIKVLHCIIYTTIVI